MIPLPNQTFEVVADYLVVFRQGPKWVIAPFETEAEAQAHVCFLAQKWTAAEITLLRNN